MTVFEFIYPILGSVLPCVAFLVPLRILDRVEAGWSPKWHFWVMALATPLCFVSWVWAGVHDYRDSLSLNLAWSASVPALGFQGWDFFDRRVRQIALAKARVLSKEWKP